MKKESDRTKNRIRNLLMAAILIVVTGSSRLVAHVAPKTMPDGGTFDLDFYAATYPDVAAYGNNEADFTKKTHLLFFHVLVPLFIAFAFYYLFCPDVLFVKYLDNFLNFSFHVPLSSNTMIRLLRNHLLDAVWAYALTVTIYVILDNHAKSKIISCYIAGSMCLAMELIQLIGVAKGTFDVIDIIIEILAVLFASQIIQPFFRRRRNEKN